MVALPAAAAWPYERKVAALHERLAALPGAIVAFSGGVDSTALLQACKAALGDRVVAVTADSPSLPRAELAEARALAERLGVRHVVLPTHELAQAGYRQNAGDRCYFCKKELFTTVAARRAEVAPADWIVVYGAIVDDLGDHRPGQRAAAEFAVQAPLVEAGLGKADVRALCRAAGLPNADKPAMACLSSRVPYGTPIDAPMLTQIERAEQAVRALGLRQVRVRHHDRLARIEVGGDELEQAFRQHEAIGRAVRAGGYTWVAIDVFGYRSGALNEVLS